MEQTTSGPRRGSPPGAGSRTPAEEWDTLATALNRRGIVHLAPAWPRSTDRPASARELFQRLWSSGDGRLHQASVLLLLTHPDLAPDARQAIAQFGGAPRDRAMRRYVAAAALQRIARTRIEQHLGPRPLLDPGYLDELGLPPIEEEFGRVTLVALSEAEQARYDYDAWGTYRELLDLFLAEIRRRDWGVPCVNASTRPA